MDRVSTPASRIHLPDMAGKKAVVTGSSQGIGRSVVELLLDNGVHVFGIDKNHGGVVADTFVQFQCDLGDVGEIERVFAEISRQADSVDYVVNVAGIDPKHSLEEVTVEQWDTLVDVNLRAYYFIIKYALPLLRMGSGRSIVNVSSINYRLGILGRAAYSATKAGILGLTTGLSRELGAESIRINTVSPGWVFTERQIESYFRGETAEGHLAFLRQKQSLCCQITSEDIANHILFYLSSLSRASTGHNCVVDAGWLLE